MSGSNTNSLIADCNRCGTLRTSFDVPRSAIADGHRNYYLFSICRNCFEPTIYIGQLNSNFSPDTLSGGGRNLNAMLNNFELQNPVFANLRQCPEFVPNEIKQSFDEAAVCLQISCNNACAAMLRRTIDLATKSLIDLAEIGDIKAEGDLSWKKYKDLRLRLDWLLTQERISGSLTPLVECVREDGNEAVHSDWVVTREAVLDLFDFTESILESIFTEPGKIARNIELRNARRVK